MDKHLVTKAEIVEHMRLQIKEHNLMGSDMFVRELNRLVIKHVAGNVPLYEEEEC